MKLITVSICFNFSCSGVPLPAAVFLALKVIKLICVLWVTTPHAAALSPAIKALAEIDSMPPSIEYIL